MKQVGATNAFIRTPFLFEGALEGLLGGLLAMIVLIVAHEILRPQIAPALLRAGPDRRLRGLLRRLGLVGSWAALHKYCASRRGPCVCPDGHGRLPAAATAAAVAIAALLLRRPAPARPPARRRRRRNRPRNRHRNRRRRSASARWRRARGSSPRCGSASRRIGNARRAGRPRAGTPRRGCAASRRRSPGRTLLRNLDARERILQQRSDTSAPNWPVTRPNSAGGGMTWRAACARSTCGAAQRLEAS